MSDLLANAWREIASWSDHEYWQMIAYLELPRERAEWVRKEAIRRARDE